MERESFRAPEVARLLNAAFMPVKVDREERPDIDAIYMQYVQASTGGGGWPLSVFLTPELEPVFGGTYFPGPQSLTTVGSAAASDTVGFLDVLEKMRDVWARQEVRCRASAQETTRQLREFAEEGVHNHHHHGENGDVHAAEGPDLELLEEAYQVMRRAYDGEHGGFGIAPKFPVTVKLRFLLQLGHWPQPLPDIVGEDECADAEHMALRALRSMARGGIRDHVGYGFSRYSVTADWALPHFEKMLPDQALLLDAYLDAYALTRDAEMLGAVLDLATYLTSAPIQREECGFFASEDADSLPTSTSTEAREGAFYTWTRSELDNILGTSTADAFVRFYGVHAAGNVPPEYDAHDELRGQNVLAIARDLEPLAAELQLPEAQLIEMLRAARQTLRAHRAAIRPRPTLDDKLVTAWNGYAIAALARAACRLWSSHPDSSQTWLASAARAAGFIRKVMWDPPTGTLRRVWYAGAPSSARGLADDYAAMAHAALELYAATLDTQWLRWADELAAALCSRFQPPDGGFYTAPCRPTVAGHSAAVNHADSEGSDDLLLRLKPGMDNSEPSANTLAANVLFRLGSLLGDEKYVQAARGVLRAFEPELEHAPAGFPGLLGALAWSHVGGGCVYVIGGDSDVRSNGHVTANGKMTSAREGQILDGVKGNLTLEKVLERLGRGLGVGRTVLRVRKEDAWLRQRNSLVGAMRFGEDSRSDTLRVMICEAGACRDVETPDDL